MKVIVKAIAGSHLFGTNTETSDRDYKGVYLPSKEQILLGSYSDTIQNSTGNEDSKNTKDDIDVELYSLKKFMKMLDNGDTAAIELLFTPEDMIIEKDPIWDEILKLKSQLISSKINAMIGYARQQANKYGTKGTRMGELGSAIDTLKKLESDCGGPKMKHAWDSVLEAFKDFNHIKFITLSAKHEGASEVPAIDILGKRFDYHCNFSYVLESITKVYKNYGQRARIAKKNGGADYKALSHALRVSYQGIELLTQGKISLPLREGERAIVSDVKQGNVKFSKVQELIEEALFNLENALESTDLPSRLDKEFLNKIIIDYHKKVIDKESEE